jgi:hypothetical protein
LKNHFNIIYHFSTYQFVNDVHYPAIAIPKVLKVRYIEVPSVGRRKVYQRKVLGLHMLPSLFQTVWDHVIGRYQELACFLVLTWSCEPDLGVELEGAASGTE